MQDMMVGDTEVYIHGAANIFLTRQKESQERMSQLGYDGDDERLLKCNDQLNQLRCELVFRSRYYKDGQKMTNLEKIMTAQFNSNTTLIE